MSKNFYLVRTCSCPCEHCSIENEHIGKMAGWNKFMWAGFTGRRSFNDWKRDLEARTIIDEYDKEISFTDFMDWVNAKQSQKSHHQFCLDRGHTGTWVDKYGYEFCAHEFS